MKTQVGKLFHKVPYFVRDINNKYKAMNEVEEVIDEFLSNYMMNIGNLESVFSNNRDSVSNFHFVVNGNMPTDSIYIEYQHDNYEITFEEYKESKTKGKNTTSLMFIEIFAQKAEQELERAFEDMIGCDGERLFVSLSEHNFNIYDPSSQSYYNRLVLIQKRDIVEEVAESFGINSAYLYKELFPNIIKQVCKDLNLTYKNLAKEIGYKPDTINKAASTGKVSEQLQRAIEMYLENLRLKYELNDFNLMKETLRKILG
jgi:DNA-binding XRE family transcriptional regulator